MKNEEKQKILEMFFIKRKKQIDIAKALNISKYKVSRIVTKDIRYQEEKEIRKKLSQQRHLENTINYINSERKVKRMKNNTDELILKNMHEQASKELSKGKRMTNIAYRNWNKSAYLYNRDKKRLEFRKELGRSYDVPKFIKLNV